MTSYSLIFAGILAVTTTATFPSSAHAQLLQRDCGVRCDTLGRNADLREDRVLDRSGVRDGGYEARRDTNRRVVPAERARGGLVGQHLSPRRVDWVPQPAVYGLGPLRPGLAYARFGREIYVVERDTGAILALALVLAATQD